MQWPCRLKFKSLKILAKTYWFATCKLLNIYLSIGTDHACDRWWKKTTVLNFEALTKIQCMQNYRMFNRLMTIQIVTLAYLNKPQKLLNLF